MVNSSSKKRRRESDSNSEDDTEREYQVEAILDKRVKGKKTEYLLKWKGYSNSDNTVRFFEKNVYSKTSGSYFSRSLLVEGHLLNKYRRIFIVKEVACQKELN
jgi:hypothetical protein